MSELDRETFEEPVELLGWLYQSAVSEQQRKRFGQFYTNPSLTKLMLDRAGYKGPKVLKSRIMDPACGAGAFLIEATRRILNAAKEKQLSPEKTYARVQQSVYGLDINPLGVLLTEAAIGLLLSEALNQLSADSELVPLNLYVTDSLEQKPELNTSDRADMIKKRAGEYIPGFDFVVANPPYAKYPSQLLSAEQKKRFSPVLYGHPNLYSMFLHLGTGLLADKGTLVFINPKSYTSGLYFKNLRLYLSRELDILNFDMFDKRAGLFNEVLQEVIILTARRASRKSKQMTLSEFSNPSAPPVKQIRVPRDSVLLDGGRDNVFLITADELAHRIFERTLGIPFLKDSGYKVTTGTVVWNRLKSRVRDDATDNARPLIWSNGIRAFEFLRLGNSERKNSHLIKDKKTQPIISGGPALLVKRLTSKEERRRIVACALPKRYAADEEDYFVRER